MAACGDTVGGGTRSEIRAVGSSTVFPFAKAVSESFVLSNPNFSSPLIESTGTGGMNLFCQGVGPSTPDLANASRRMKLSEFETCQENGVTDIVELQVGLDGLAFASARGGLMMNLSPKIVYEALAARPYGVIKRVRLGLMLTPHSLMNRSSFMALLRLQEPVTH